MVFAHRKAVRYLASALVDFARSHKRPGKPTMTQKINRRDVLRAGAAACALSSLNMAVAAEPATRNLADAGWCWDGQAMNGQPQLSIFGIGEGTKWFGLRKCCFMFHPITPMALEKLSSMDAVVCEISKWEVAEVLDHPKYKGLGRPLRMNHDGRIERKCQEAKTVSRLSPNFPNVAGAIDDDLYGKIKRENIEPDQYAKVREALRSNNPKLKLRGVVYSHELNRQNWAGFIELLDEVTLWVWASKDLIHLEGYVAQCRAIFPKATLLIGCYLRDFTLLDGVPMDRLKHQWEVVRKLVYNGTIGGYSILAGCLIDLHPQQARWVRDFIRAN